MNFMHFYNSCTQNCDYHILLIMTGNAHKVLPQIIIDTGEGAGIETSSKLIVAAKSCLFSWLKKKLFIGKPILRCGTAPFLFIFVVLSS